MTRNCNQNYKLVLIIVSLVLAITLIAGAVSYARFREDFNPTNDAYIAPALATIDFTSIYRTDAEGVKERISFEKNGGTVTVNDVEPQDAIDFYFAVSDANGVSVNEVLLKITLTVSVRLEMIFSNSNAVRQEYFEGWKTYGIEDGTKNQGYLKILRGGNEANESQIRPSSGTSHGVDYTGYSLHIEKNNGKILNKFGFFMQPYSQAISEYVFHVSFTLPTQSAETENYAGARVYFDVNMDCEQSDS